MYLLSQVSLSNNFSRKLYKLLNFKCKDCSDCLQNNIESSPYVERLNRGGLTIPSQSLNTYLQMAFTVIESIESKVLHSGIPAKILTATLLNLFSTDWESSFSCQSHTQENRKLINCKICNIYFSNLAKAVTETKRKDQVESFKYVNVTHYSISNNFQQYHSPKLSLFIPLTLSDE